MQSQMMLEAPNWLPFIVVNQLAQKAGITPYLLPKLIAKELMDNALDESDKADCGHIGGNGFYVRDYGRGMDKSMIEKLFSVKRTTASTKQWLLPTRGAQGNGLRVVTGFLIATNSKMLIHSKEKKYQVNYDQEGNTKASFTSISDVNKGTLVEFFISDKTDFIVDLRWAKMAIALNAGRDYKGSTSPHWYDVKSMGYNLLSTTGQTLRQFITMFDGCKGAKAGEIASYFDTQNPKELATNDNDIIRLLDLMNKYSSPVNANRLGEVGKDAFPDFHYMKKTNEIRSRTVNIPYVMELWVRKADKNTLSFSINKTPINGEVYANVKMDKRLLVRGCGLYLECKPKVNHLNLEVMVNIQTPYYPKENDGKKPDLFSYHDELGGLLNTLIGRVKRNEPKEKKFKPPSQKEVILRHLLKSVNEVSSEGRLRFSERQLYYQIRPMVFKEAEKQLDYDYFSRVITDYESENGNIPNIYRDTRGILYEPHGYDKPLGTQMVEEYERPTWEYNKVLYCEKEGLFEVLKDVRFAERHDCALLTSKGFATRAAKDLIDKIAETDEEVTFYCVHDGDAPGTMIYQSLVEKTRTRRARNVYIKNLGLEPWEGREMGLESEKAKYERDPAVADYVSADWKIWLRSNRFELNSMKPAQFIEWLDKKMESHKKVIPPESVMIEQLDSEVKNNLEQHIKDRILKKYNLKQLTEEEYKKIKPRIKEIENEIYEGIVDDLKDLPSHNWKKTVSEIADDLLENV